MYSYNVHIFYVCVLYIVLYVFMWVRIQIFFVWNCPSQSPLTTFMWCFPLFSITKWGLYYCHYTYIQFFLAFYNRYIFSPHSFPFYCLGSALFCAVLLHCFLRTDNTRALRRTFGKATFYGYIRKTGTTKYFLCDVLNVGFFI